MHMHLQFKSFLSRKCQQTYYQELKKIFFSDLSKSNLFKNKNQYIISIN